MLRKGDIEDWLKAMGKDIKSLNKKEKIKLFLAPYFIYIGAWLLFYFLAFMMLSSLFGFEVFL